jgi:hypothetical protein
MIRLLEIYPGITSDTLRGSIRHVKLMDVASSFSSASRNDGNSAVLGDTYEAISYVWGGAFFTSQIESAEGFITITPRLEEALKRVRLQNCKRIIWADGVCIDQNNKEEQGQQVKLMRQIYSRARKVLVWFGIDHNLRAQEIFNRLRGWPLPTSEENQNIVQELLDTCSWFDRSWVVQEVCLATSATVMWGDEEIQWEHLRLAIQLFRKKLPRHKLLSSIFSLNDENGFIQTLTWAKGLKCTDDRDRVYAFLGLSFEKDSHSTIATRIEPDYTISTYQVYYNLGVKAVEAGHLSALLDAVNHGPSLHAGPTDLPSWVPDWRRQRTAPKLLSLGTINGSVDLNTRHLKVSGLSFDTVQSLSGSLTHNLDYASDKEALAAFWSKDISPMSEAQAFPETLKPNIAFCAAVLCARSLGLWGQRSLFHSVKDFITRYEGQQELAPVMIGSAMISSIKHTLELHEPLPEYPPLGYDSNHDDPECLAGSRLFKTAQNFIGNGPESVQKRDMIVYLEGGCGLYVVRPQQGYYQFIGRVYLAGLTNERVGLKPGCSKYSKFLLQ